MNLALLRVPLSLAALVATLVLFGPGSRSTAWAQYTSRFGDSTWIAPTAGSEGDPETEGPRVAYPDHERAGEAFLRAPFRIAFLPLRLIARGIEATGPMVERFVPPGGFRDHAARPGLYFSPELLGATVGYREPLGPGSKMALTGTWSLNNTTRLRFRGYVGERVSPVGAGVDALYERKPSRRFYGIGNLTPDAAAYFFRRSELAQGHLFAGRNHLRRLRFAVGVSDIDVGSPRGRTPSALDVFDPVGIPFLTEGTRLWWYGANADFAAMDDSLEPSLGIHFRPAVRRYQDRDQSGVRYDWWRLEARAYAPVLARQRVLAARLIFEGADPRPGAAPIPFYRLPESAEDDAFAAYPYGRFRDRRLALGRLEYRWELVRPVSAFLLGELGAVAPTASAFNLGDAHHSYGGGLRVPIGDSRVVQLQLAQGEEGLRVHGTLRSRW